MLQSLAPIPAVLEYATNLNSHTCLQIGTQFANKRLSCKQVPRLQTNASHATNKPKANQRTSCKQIPRLQTATLHANRHSVCKQTPLMQTSTTLANKHHACNKHTACKQMPLMQRTHLKQTSAPHATNTPKAKQAPKAEVQERKPKPPHTAKWQLQKPTAHRVPSLQKQ